MSTGETLAVVIAVAVPALGGAVSFGFLQGAVRALRDSTHEMRLGIESLRDWRTDVEKRLGRVEAQQNEREPS